MVDFRVILTIKQILTEVRNYTEKINKLKIAVTLDTALGLNYKTTWNILI